MSDMRLTSSKTKMKINLCIFLLCNTAVSVFGEPQELNGIVGKRIEFPAAVKIDGNLIHSGVSIGDVTSGRFTPPRDGGYSGRVQWDSSTGLFSLSELKMEDIGEYKVQNTDQDINTVFQLNVYIPVSKPHVRVTRNEYPCTIECTAETGTGVTLTLYKNSEKEPYVTLPVRSQQYLHLPVESGTYTCEVKNSVSRETSDPLTVEAHCTAPAGPNALAIVFGISAVVALFAAGFFAYKYHRIRKEQAGETMPTLPPEDKGKQALIQDVWDIVCRPKASKTMTPSHPTEVPLNQATPEVGE